MTVDKKRIRQKIKLKNHLTSVEYFIQTVDFVRKIHLVFISYFYLIFNNNNAFY